MNLEVVIPYRDGCPHRARALTWVLDQYRTLGWNTTVAADSTTGAWCKAAAAMPAIHASRADVVVLADADAWTDGLPAALHAIDSGRARWAIPHDQVHRLTEHATSLLLDGHDWRDLELAERAYRGVQGGGITIARRQVLLDAPLDPRFQGWGQEDESHALALHCLHGRPWRGTAPLVHLYHPPQPRETRRRGSTAGWRMFHAYRRARRDPSAMRRLAREAHAALHAAQHADHDHPARQR